MTRRLNTKLALCLAILAIIMAVGIHFLHAFQVKRGARSFLELAESAEEDGRLSEAAHYLDLYLRCVPQDTEALARYGQIVDKLARSQRQRLQALAIFERVLRRDPSRADIRRQLVGSAMDLGSYTQAADNLLILLKAAPNDGDLEYRLAVCYEADREDLKAVEFQRRAILHAPAQMDSYVRLARLLRRLDRPKEADKVMDELVAANPRAFAAFVARALYRKEFGSLAEAEKDVAHARDRLAAADEADVLWASAAIAHARGKPDDARTYLRRGVQLHPRHAAMYRSLAELELEAGRPQQAEAYFRRGLEAISDQTDLQWALADALIRQGNEEEAAALVDRLRDSAFPDPLVQYLAATLLVKQKEWARASAELEKLDTALGQWPGLRQNADLLLAHCQEQLGNPDRQYVYCRRALVRDSASVPAALGMASALVALGMPDDALEIYRRLAPRVAETRLALARVLIRRNVSWPPAQRHWDEVDAILNELVRAQPESVEVTLLRAEALSARDQHEQAEQLLTRARDQQPRQVAYWTALAGLAELQGKPATILALLTEAEKHVGDRVELRLARATYWASHGGPKARAELLRLTMPTRTSRATISTGSGVAWRRPSQRSTPRTWRHEHWSG
jgi:tetratricopeptide (TPR) repeat protein